MRATALILVLAVAVLAAALASLRAFEFLFPWEPPNSSGNETVLRVMAPPGQPYRVAWGGAWWQFWREDQGFVSKVDKGRVIRNHLVKPTGDGEYEFTVTKVARQAGGGYQEASAAWEGDLRAVLYVGGEVATCGGAWDTSLRLVWHEGDGMGNLSTRAICSRYQLTRSSVTHVGTIALVAVPLFFLISVAALRGLSGRQASVEAERGPTERGPKPGGIAGLGKEQRASVEAERRRKAEERRRMESVARLEAVRDEVNHMDGLRFERFMADLFQQKGYGVQQTPATGDQGVDLLLDINDKKVAVQLKRWAGSVGNAVVAATFAGMTHYRADEGWIVTTSTFTRSARELAKSTKVRLIDGKELAKWLEDLG